MPAASPAVRPRPRDTRLEAQGAEFLVLGSLLAEGIAAWKAYTNFPGYDILAGDPAMGRVCRIQVKSRFVTGAGGFPISNFDCDFVCFVRLNRGSRRSIRQDASARRAGNPEADGRRPPEIYVLPKPIVRRAWVAGTAFGQGGVTLSAIRDPEQYLHAWQLVADHLSAAVSRRR